MPAPIDIKKLLHAFAEASESTAPLSISFRLGFDSTLPAGAWRKEAIRAAERNAAALETLLRTSSRGRTIVVRLAGAGDAPIAPPSGGSYEFVKDLDLVGTALDAIRNGESHIVPVLITDTAMKLLSGTNVQMLNGYTSYVKDGFIVRLGSNGEQQAIRYNPNIFAHELGHVADYNLNGSNHSADPQSVMHEYVRPGNVVGDAEYFRRIETLAIRNSLQNFA